MRQLLYVFTCNHLTNSDSLFLRYIYIFLENMVQKVPSFPEEKRLLSITEKVSPGKVSSLRFVSWHRIMKDGDPVFGACGHQWLTTPKDTFASTENTENEPRPHLNAHNTKSLFASCIFSNTACMDTQKHMLHKPSHSLFLPHWCSYAPTYTLTLTYSLNSVLRPCTYINTHTHTSTGSFNKCSHHGTLAVTLQTWHKGSSGTSACQSSRSSKGTSGGGQLMQLTLCHTHTHTYESQPPPFYEHKSKW